jgi:hypothetical protein
VIDQIRSKLGFKVSKSFIYIRDGSWIEAVGVSVIESGDEWDPRRMGGGAICIVSFSV